MNKCCLVHDIVQREPRFLDYSHLDMTVICRIGFGYADGTGTLPVPGSNAERDFIHAVTDTVLSGKGVDYWHIGNEPNNRQEFPGFGTDHETPLTKESVVQVYNEIYDRAGSYVNIGPPPLDPYFGPGSNNMEWWEYMMRNIIGAGALFLHAKTQYSDPSQVWSKDKFEHDPLKWQYLHLRAVEPYLDAIPDRLLGCPVYVTEVNTQRKGDGSLGWESDNVEWIHEAVKYFKTQLVDGIVFYRYDPADPWGLADKPQLLNAIREETHGEIW